MTTMPPVPQTAAAPLATTGPSSPDVSTPNGQTVFWLRKPGAKKRQTILIQGGRIQQNWLQQRLRVTQVRFQGPLAQALTDLQQASKKSKEKFLPIVRLRAALMASLDGVLRLDRDFGLGEAGKPALEIRHEEEQDSGVDIEQANVVRDTVLSALKRWHLDVLLPWAERNDVGDIASRVRPAINTDGISVVHVSLPLADAPASVVKKPQFDLIARQIAERLVGEELFDGLGPCEIVADPTSKKGTVELMTAPTKVAGNDIVFSMAAHLSVFTLPYSADVYLRVSAIKRVWATKVPGRKPNAPPTVKGYIIAPNKPILLARVRCPAKEWEFDDDYLQYLAESKGKLPSQLKDAVARTMPDDSGWWFGLPKLTTLFDKVGGRTVFEGDEFDLHARVMSLLPDVVQTDIPFREVRLDRKSSVSEVAMLKLTDLGLEPENVNTGLAGAALLDAAESDIALVDEVGEPLTVDQKRVLRIQRHRAANVLALGQVHANQIPVLWVFGASTRERLLIEACVTELFGQAVQVAFEILPEGVHGLKQDLDASNGKGVERFDVRVKRWEHTAKQIPQDGGPRHVLICAPKEINGRPEDPVNYYAGLHAMCSMADANVHHILPIEIDRRTQKPDEQNFVHRLQSALLDVFMAHSGVVLGTKSFVGSRLPAPLPQAIYGIQVVRSRAKNFTSESSVSFLLFTRLVIASGTTEVRFAYRSAHRTMSKGWMPLNEGLRWLGSQRQITSDEPWVKENFAGQVRTVLGELAKADPRAVVLIDWSTVGGLWPGINDSSLASGQSNRVMLDSANLALACPEMTFVRLRATRDATMSLRKRSTMLYEAWKNEPALAPTGDVVEETYTTTLKTIVELNAAAGSSEAVAKSSGPHHYLMVMGYRKTVQILRGMSCYRTMRRMKALDTDESDDKEGKRFDWEAVSPSKDDAALPASLEVTVLSCPKDVVPDEIARLVMGLRLGYAHYDEWTASPAPLFFAAKVQDYIIRYPDTTSDGPEPDDTDTPPDDAEDKNTTHLIDTYFGDVEKAVLGEAVAEPAHRAEAIEETQSVQEDLATYDSASEHAEKPTDSFSKQPTNALLSRAWESASQADKLYARKFGTVQRKLYEDMICSSITVLVDLPWFVTRKTIIDEGVWPDSRAIKRYWQTQGDIGYRRSKGVAPTTAEFPQWMMRRLRIPQSAYTIDSFGLLPDSSRVFSEASEAFYEYLKIYEAQGDKFPDIDKLTTAEVETYARWLVREKGDAGTAWTLCQLAHFPFRLEAQALLHVLDENQLGPMTLAATQYFIDCNEVVSQALKLRQQGIRKIPDLVRRAMPMPVTELAPERKPTSKASEASDNGSSASSESTVNSALPSTTAFEVSAFSIAVGKPTEDSVRMLGTPLEPPMPRHVLVQAITRLRTEAGTTPRATAPETTTQVAEPSNVSELVRLAALLVPGADDFEQIQEAVFIEVDRLVAEHSAHQQAAREAHQLQLFREQIVERLSRILIRTNIVLSKVTAELMSEQTGQFSVVKPDDLGFLIDDERLTELEATVSGVEGAVEDAQKAHARLEDVESASAPEFHGLSSVEKARRRRSLLDAAIEEFDQAQHRLNERLLSCPILRPASSSSMETRAAVALSEVTGAEAATVNTEAVGSHAETRLASDTPTSTSGSALDVEAEPAAVRLEQGHVPAEATFAQAVATGPEDPEPSRIKDVALADVDTVTLAAPPASIVVETAGSVGAHGQNPVEPDLSTADAGIAADIVGESGEVVDGNLSIEVPDPRGMLATLNRSIQARHWGLSQACIQAMRAVTPPQVFDFHTMAWSAMLSTLAGLASRAAVEPRLSPELRKFLDSGGTSDSSPASPEAPCSTLASTLGLLGAGIIPMLFEGHEGAARWAVLVQARARLIDHPPLLDLVDRLSSLNSTSLMLSRETMSAVRVGVRESLNAELKRQRERAGSWQSDAAIYTHWTASDYVEMHRAMFDDKHALVLGKCMGLIYRGSDDAARKLLPEVRKYVEKLAGTLSDLRKRTGRKRAFEGPARDYLASNLEISVRFIEDFFGLLDRSQSVASSDLPKNLVDFLVNLYKDLNEAVQYMRDLGFAQPMELVHRDLTAEVLSGVLRMMDDHAQPPTVSDEEQLLLLQLPLDRDLRPTLNVSLDTDDEASTPLTDPFTVFSEVDAIEDDLAEREAIAGSKALADLLERAAQRHRDSGRLLPARAIEARLPRASVAAAHSANEAAQRKQRSQFAEDLNEARQRTMNAMSMGALAEVEASRMLKAIESLNLANVAQEIGSVSGSATAYTDYPQVRVLLRHHVLEPLASRIQQSRERLEGAINAFSVEAENANPDPQAHARMLENIKRIRLMLEDGSPSGIRVAHNAFALLKEDRLPLLRLEEFSTAQAYEEFQASLKATSAGHRPLDHLVELLRAEASPSDAEWMSRLDSEQRQEAAVFIGHWIALCASRQTADLHEPLTEFFAGLGTAESPAPMHGVGHAGRLAFFLPIKTFVGTDRSGHGMFIPPSLGSAANHIQGFVLKHQASTEAFGQIITECAQSTPTFVLARTSLSLAKRSAISRDHPVILVDDDLVAYLAVHPGERVSKLMEVGLLTFTNNPYDDYGGRPVPPEMFFGRKAELRLLRGVKSAAVLYGGRRLGKSSLLDQIQNDSRQQLQLSGVHGQGEMAIYIPLETRLDTASFGENHRLFAWCTIYNSLVKAKFIGAAKGDLLTPEAIRDWISGEVVGGRAATNSCYLLIDEADEVMREDLNGEALFITNLQALCDQVRSHCQMRYVIAGLHNLTRMTTVGNSVLGKAETIALQPFSTDVDILNGIELITRPLAALGFYFPKGAENLPLRIMALCNFYPAFIQLYCKNLVTRLYNKRVSAAPPTMIEASDLDAVERDDEFLREIQKKFELNLDLDKRYKAIALILADVYYANAGQGVSLGLTTAEIRDHCQAFTPEHFLTTTGAAYEALLEEMEKLTVLERNGTRFQLRTPHIATMLGTRERVSRLIEELASDKPSESRIPGESRLIIRQDREEKVFPMPSAWVRSLLRGSDGDLVVLVGNQLSGLYNIDKLPKEWELGQDAVYEVKLFSSPDNARTHLQRARRLTDNAPTRRLVALPPRSWRANEVEGYAALAGSLMSKPTTVDPSQRQRLASIRLALIASPDLAWELAAQIYPAGSQTAQVTKGWRVEPVPAWGDDAVFYRFDQHQNTTVRDSGKAREALIEATCGFGTELDRLCTGGASIESAMKAAEEEQRLLAPNLATFYAKVGVPQAIAEADLREIEQLLALIDGERRADEGVGETIRSTKVTKAQFEFFQWMGLLQVHADGRWRVPTPYKRLIG